MSRPSVRILDGELQSVADLTGVLRRLATDYVYEDPSIERNRFGFADNARKHPRTATVEINNHPIAEKLLTMHKDESVFAALVLDGKISRWVVEGVFSRTNGIHELRLVPMNPYAEALAKERIHFGKKTPHVPDAAAEPTPEPEPTVVDTTPAKKAKKRKKAPKA